MNEKIDIKLIAQTALGQTEPLVQNWLPNGKREGVYWISLNPTRVDNKTGSFKVNINTGQCTKYKE